MNVNVNVGGSIIAEHDLAATVRRQIYLGLKRGNAGFAGFG